MTTDVEMRKAAIARDLEAARAELLSAVAEVGDSDWERMGPNGEWNVRDLVAHVASGEATIQTLLRRMASGGGGVPDDFDLDRYNASQLRRRVEKSVPELLAELESARRQTLQALAEASEEALSRRGRHPRGFEASLEETFGIIALHDREHAGDIRRALGSQE